MSDQDELRQLLSSPSETLDVELKQWIDPTAPDGIAKIAKGCLALRNNNGGRLIVGVRDDGAYDTDSVPADVRQIFHADTIQAIVSRFAAEPFAVRVEFVEVDEQEHPVITVPNGVLTPVAAKSDLPNPNGGRPLIRDNAVYVRSVNSNNTVSSTEARRGDWERLVSICFDNREADVGRFVRRHLAGVLEPETFRALVQSRVAAQILHTASDRAIELLDVGFQRFESRCDERKVKIPKVGFREFAVKIDGELPSLEPTENLLQQLRLQAPRLTGWSPWEIILGAADELKRPFVADGAWEFLFARLDDRASGPKLDFWRIDPTGEFYDVRAFEDDFAAVRNPHQRPSPGTQLDFMLQISRVAEGIAVAMAMARAMGCPLETTVLEFAAKWRGISGRHLSSWVDLHQTFYSPGEAIDDQLVANVSIPLDTPRSGISQFVEPIIRRLFATFGGTEVSSTQIENIVSETLNRNL